ncbi:unnamed protein product [Rhodiola kirilowii]
MLILISDTGGGHRASAEVIHDAFRLEFGDEYNIYVKDVWKEYTGWPLNSLESQYKFMVKHVQLWNVAFHSTSPKWFHSVYLVRPSPPFMPIYSYISKIGGSPRKGQEIAV